MKKKYADQLMEDIRHCTDIEKSVEKNTVSLTEEENKTLELINKYREQNGLNELEPFLELQEVSKLKAEDIVENNYFSHTSPNLGSTFDLIKSQGIKYKVAGENLAGNITPKRAVEAWINSKTHRENILEDRFEYTGIYVIESEVYGKIFVQMFIGIK